MSDAWAVVDVADLHCGDRAAIAPIGFELDEGGRITLASMNVVQRTLWRRLGEVWHWIDEITEGRQRLIRLLGDLVDGRYHPKAHMLTQDVNEQRRMVAELLQKCLHDGDRLEVIRGTEAHDGLGGQDAEAIAQALGVPVDEKTRSRSVFHSLVEINGVVLSASHAVGVSHSPVTDFSALAREWLKATRDAVQWKATMPTIITRAHRHQYNYAEYAGQCMGGRMAVFTLPCWQARTSWAYRAGPFSLPQIGAVVTLIEPDGRWRVEPRIWSLPAPVPRRLPDA
jgi:hypothetical protein